MRHGRVRRADGRGGSPQPPAARAAAEQQDTGPAAAAAAAAAGAAGASGRTVALKGRRGWRISSPIDSIIQLRCCVLV